MKIRKFINRFLMLSFLIALCVPVISFANEPDMIESKSQLTIQRIEKRAREIREEQEQREQTMRMKLEGHNQRMAVLQRDMEIFLAEGDQGIGEDNMFYPIHKSNLTIEEMDIALKGTGLEGTGRAFVEVEEKYGINALFLAAIANHESFYGESNIAKEKNNLFGFNANDADPYNLASQYSSYEDCIVKVGKKLKEFYLSEDGRYFKGFSATGMNYYYSSDSNWPNKVNGHMIAIAKKILEDSDHLFADLSQ